MPQGILFGQKAPTIGFEPENVMGDSAPIVSPFRRNRRSQIVQPAPTTAVDLHKRYVESPHVPSPADARLELERARTLNTLMAQQHKDRAGTRQLVAGAALAEALGQLDVTDPNYRVKAAQLFTQYPEGANSPAAETVAKMKHEEFTSHNKAQSVHREAVYNATLQKRIEPLLSSDAVPFALKNQLMNEDGGFNSAAVQQAEAIHAGNGGKAGAEFYANLQKVHGYTKSDLDSLVADPSTVKYVGPNGPVTAEAVRGKEKDFRAVSTLPNGGGLNLPLTEFNSLITTHKNLSRQPGASADDLAAQEQLFKDRSVMETTLATQGLVPASATPPGYAEWKTQRGMPPAAAPAAAPSGTPAPTVSPIDFLKRALGTAPAPAPVAAPTAAPTAAPAASPVAAAGAPPGYEAWTTPGGTASGLRAINPNDAPVAASSGLPDDEENRLDGT